MREYDCLKLRSHVHLCTVEGISSPAFVRIPFPTVLIPAEMETSEDAALAVRHELMHYRRGDHLLMLAADILKALWWFNPFAYTVFRAMQQDVEAACDAAVVRGCSPAAKAAYADMLIALSRSREISHAVLSMSPARWVEARIRSVFGPYRSRRGIRSAAVLLAGVLAVTCFTTACQPASPAEIRTDQQRNTAAAAMSSPDPAPGLQKEVQAAKASAAERWQDEMEMDGMKIMVDAPVEVPETERFPVVKVRPTGFPAATVEKILDYFADDAVLYENDNTYEAWMTQSIREQIIAQELQFQKDCGVLNEPTVDESHTA